MKKGETFDVIQPLNPSVQHKMELIKSNQIPREEEHHFQFEKNGEENELRYRYFNLVTFLQCFINISNVFFSEYGKNIYSPYKIRILYEKLWKIFFNRKADEELLLQQQSKLVMDLIKENSSFVVEYKNEIFDVFQSDEFFNANVNSLRVWGKILDRYLDEINPDILSSYLEKVTFSSMFSSKSTENKLRIKSFQRICFVVFAGGEKFVDKEKLRVFLVKIKEVLKDKDVHPHLVVLIFFTLRILILKLKKETLNDLLKSLWSSILFLIDQMLCSEQEKKREEIFISALKLLELISYSDIEEFNLHRWAFLFEYFGVKIEMN